MKRHEVAALWFILCALLSIFNVCTIQIFDGFDWPFYAVSTNAVLSVVGIFYHMHAQDRRRGQNHTRLPERVGSVLLAANSIMVFPMLFLSLFTLSGEYHTPLSADARVTSAEEVPAVAARVGKSFTLLETKDLYVYWADYGRLSYESGKRPSRNDQDVLLCVAAAFQSTYQIVFNEDNIVGWHTSQGRLERGTPQDDLGAFTYVDGVPRIWDAEEAEEAVRDATERGGFGYQSFIVLKDGEQGVFDTYEFRCFRALALVGDRVAVIDSRTFMHYKDFVQTLRSFGVSDAIYCDMGSGWNYSWFRSDDHHTETIIGMPWPFSHNWLTFRKNAA